MRHYVRDKAGVVHEIEGPEDATPEEIEGIAAAALGGQQRTFRVGDPIPGTKGPQKRGGTGGGLAKIPTTPNPHPYGKPTDGMSPFKLGAAGLGEAITNAGRGIVGALPGVDNSQDVAEARERDADLNATPEGGTANFVGTAGMMLAPGAALKGAGMVARATGATTKADQLSLAGGTFLAPKGIFPAAGVGGATGYIQPAASPGERAMNTVVNAGASAALPIASRTYKAGMSAAEPFYEGGREAIVGRTLNRAAGSDAPNVLTRLEAGSAPAVGPFRPGQERATVGELVPGSVPTTAQLADNAGIGKLELSATAVNPEAGQVMKTRVEGQNAARVDVLRDVAGTPAEQNAAVRFRNDASSQTYDHAFTAPLDPQRVAAAQPHFDKLSANPYIQDAVPGARKLAAGDGVDLDAGSVQGMHYLKLALDDAIARGSSPATAAGRNTLRQMQQAQHDLVEAMAMVSPEYDSARAWHQTLSQPINQHQVGQAIADKSIDPLTGNIRPGNFARALTDDTAAKATWPGGTLENTLDNSSENRLRMLLADLQRSDKASRVATGRGSPTAQNLAYANMMEQSGLPSYLTDNSLLQFGGNLASRVGDIAYGKANNRLSELLAEALTDPATVARLMRKTGPYADNGLAEILRLGVQGSSVALPSAVHANK